MPLPVLEAPRLRVGLNDIDWLSKPGAYAVDERGINDADRARMSRIARKAGLVMRSSRTVDGILVDLRPVSTPIPDSGTHHITPTPSGRMRCERCLASATSLGDDPSTLPCYEAPRG